MVIVYCGYLVVSASQTARALLPFEFAKGYRGGENVFDERKREEKKGRESGIIQNARPRSDINITTRVRWWRKLRSTLSDGAKIFGTVSAAPSR